MAVKRRQAQAETPDSFHNLWFVGGMPGEDPNAGRVCRATGYVDVDGRDMVHVVFVGQEDLFDDREAVFTPWQLFPVMP